MSLVCRLCFILITPEKEDFHKSTRGRISSAHFLAISTFPRIDMDITQQPNICEKCNAILEDLNRFTCNVDSIEKKIEQFIQENKDVVKVDLKCLTDQVGEGGSFICRTCLKVMTARNEFKPVNCISESYKNIPNVGWYKTDDPVVCNECDEKINKMYKFEKNCLHMQEILYQRIKAKNSILLNKDLLQLKDEMNRKVETTIKSKHISFRIATDRNGVVRITQAPSCTPQTLPEKKVKQALNMPFVGNGEKQNPPIYNKSNNNAIKVPVSSSSKNKDNTRLNNPETQFITTSQITYTNNKKPDETRVASSFNGRDNITITSILNAPQVQSTNLQPQLININQITNINTTAETTNTVLMPMQIVQPTYVVEQSVPAERTIFLALEAPQLKTNSSINIGLNSDCLPDILRKGYFLRKDGEKILLVNELTGVVVSQVDLILNANGKLDLKIIGSHETNSVKQLVLPEESNPVQSNKKNTVPQETPLENSSLVSRHEPKKKKVARKKKKKNDTIIIDDESTDDDLPKLLPISSILNNEPPGSSKLEQLQSEANFKFNERVLDFFPKKDKPDLKRTHSKASKTGSAKLPGKSCSTANKPEKSNVLSGIKFGVSHTVASTSDNCKNENNSLLRKMLDSSNDASKADLADSESDRPQSKKAKIKTDSSSDGFVNCTINAINESSDIITLSDDDDCITILD